jgi:dolichol-phosphate mannosyltransferase
MDGSRIGKRQLHACIVVPTYNEARNIKPLLDQIFRQDQLCSKKDGIKLSVLVVDDNSPDGTAKIVRFYRHANKRVYLLSRSEKNGLGAAYIAGMLHAMKTLNPDIIMEMDADGQHNPADIYRLLREIKRGADFVIGSRYIPGGSVPESWGAHRKLISRAANLYTKTVLQTGDVKDCTGGFRAIRTSVLKKIDLQSLDVKGYAFQVTLLDAALRNGAIAHEVPIAFSTRTAGESKMRPKDMILGGLLILRLRAKRIPFVLVENKKGQRTIKIKQ